MKTVLKEKKQKKLYDEEKIEKSTITNMYFRMTPPTSQKVFASNSVGM